MHSQAEKAETFRHLHNRPRAFIIPNPWDRGTALILAHRGFEALATTSAGFAYSLGRPDYAVQREEMLAHLGTITSATDLPVSADLENGFGDTPECVRTTIELAASAGVVGGSIEDATGDPHNPIYDMQFAAERIAAASDSARRLPFPFMVTARAENYLLGRPDLKDTITRLQAYQNAGADVLYAPGLTNIGDIRTVVQSVDRPLNVLVGIKGMTVTLVELAEIGVKRISLGSAMCRVALGAFFEAIREMQERGSFHFAEAAVGYADLNRFLSSGPTKSFVSPDASTQNWDLPPA